MKIILGSQSKQRKRIFEQAGYDFDVMIADIDEKAIRSENYEELPMLIARAKAQKLLPMIHEDAILITSDQVVVCNGELREKPESEEQARDYLRSYGTHPAQANTAVVVINTKTGEGAEGTDISQVYFKEIPEEVINKVILEGDVMNMAGAFSTENPHVAPYVDHIDGDHTGVEGLPIKLTESLMDKVRGKI